MLQALLTYRLSALAVPVLDTRLVGNRTNCQRNLLVKAA